MQKQTVTNTYFTDANNDYLLILNYYIPIYTNSVKKYDTQKYSFIREKKANIIDIENYVPYKKNEILKFFSYFKK